MMDSAEFMDGWVPHAEKPENGSGQCVHRLAGDIQFIVTNKVAACFGVDRDNVSLVARKKLGLDLLEPPRGSTKR
jgi:hypothetical protein